MLQLYIGGSYAVPNATMTLSTVNFSTIGLDVHKNRLVACAVHVQHDAKGREVHEKEYFESTGTYSGRQRLTEWCSSQNADLILMESTGIFWKAPFRDLEKADLHPSPHQSANL